MTIDQQEIDERITEVFLLPVEKSNDFVGAIQMGLHDWSKHEWTDVEKDTICKYLAIMHQDMEPELPVSWIPDEDKE